MKSTQHELVSILETALQDPKYTRFTSTEFKLKRMIERAKAGDYHDAKSKSKTPKHDLSIELRTIGMYDIADMVDQGEFNEGRDS